MEPELQHPRDVGPHVVGKEGRKGLEQVGPHVRNPDGQGRREERKVYAFVSDTTRNPQQAAWLEDSRL